MKSGTPTVIVKMPRNVGVVAASKAGIAPAASSTPTVVSMLAVASVPPGFAARSLSPESPAACTRPSASIHAG